jgi:hypothetical protein
MSNLCERHESIHIPSLETGVLFLDARNATKRTGPFNLTVSNME